MSLCTVLGTLASAVADAGTFTVSYPAIVDGGLSRTSDEGDFYLAMGHKFVLGQSVEVKFPVKFDLTFGTASITVTNKSGSTWPAGTSYILQLERQGKKVYVDLGTGVAGLTMSRMARADTFLINLGAPDTIDDDGICASQNRTGAGVLLVNGALASGGVATLDVPRNVIVDSGGADTAVITVTGKDEYGNTVVESITMNGTTGVSGKKAFKTITGVSASATISNGFFLGPGDVLGLPVFLPSVANIVKEIQDGAVATAGTTVAGIRTAGGSTATTGDVRGTYDPNAACDGDKVFQLIVSLPDPGYKGIDQYAG